MTSGSGTENGFIAHTGSGSVKSLWINCVEVDEVVRELMTVRMPFASTTRADILQAIPGMGRFDGWTVEYEAQTTVDAYKMVRLVYKYISW